MAVRCLGPLPRRGVELLVDYDMQHLGCDLVALGDSSERRGRGAGPGGGFRAGQAQPRREFSAA
jgi:hypothetical protein